MWYRLYFDYSATCFVEKCVVDLYKDEYKNFYNPNVTYDNGRDVYNKIESSKENIINYFDKTFPNLIISGSGTEANNLAIRGYIYKNFNTIKHIVIGSAEHPSIMSIFQDDFILYLLKDVKIDFVPLEDETGRYSLEKFKGIIREDTDLVCIMKVNNVTGAVNDLKSFIEYVNLNTFVYSDYTQYIGKSCLDFEELKLLSAIGFSTHKIGCFKGSGCLLINDLNIISPLYNGSSFQEYGMLPGTQNHLVYMSISKVLNKYDDNSIRNNYIAVEKLKMLFLQILNDNGIEYTLTIPFKYSLPQLLSIRFKSVKADVVQNYVNMKYGYMFSLSSACSEKSNELDYVLNQLSLSIEEQKSTCRISFHYKQSEDMVRDFAMAISEAVENYV